MDVFYLRPVSKEVSEKDYWYECAPVEKEKLRKFVEAMCQEAEIYEKKTNHSLRATVYLCNSTLQGRCPRKDDLGRYRASV